MRVLRNDAENEGFEGLDSFKARKNRLGNKGFKGFESFKSTNNSSVHMYYIIIFGNYETAQLCAIRKLRNSELRDLDCAIRKLRNPELRDKTLLVYLRPGHKIDLSAYRTERTLNSITIYEKR